MIIRNSEDIEILKEGGKRLSFIMDKLEEFITSGVLVDEINALTEKLIEENGDIKALLGYKPYGASYPYPSTICVSVNNEVVHGIAKSNKRILKEGDIVGIDLVIAHKGLYTDMARTVSVGQIKEEDKRLMSVTKNALDIGINEVKPGKRVGDIGFVMSAYVRKNGFSMVEDLGGHGVGLSVHEEPFIPNYGSRGQGELIKEGMVLALEPIVNAGKKDVILAKDDYTYLTKDGLNSAHFEHTILVTKDGAEILTI